jgi:hypothetical protein
VFLLIRLVFLKGGFYVRKLVLVADPASPLSGTPNAARTDKGYRGPVRFILWVAVAATQRTNTGLLTLKFEAAGFFETPLPNFKITEPNNIHE